MSGHIFDMVNRIAQNKIPRRKKFKGNNREHMHSEKFNTETEYDFPNVSGADMEGIKQSIRQDTKTENRKSLFILTIVVALVALAFWTFLKYYKVDSFVIY